MTKNSEPKYTLSIVILTMNRKEQLLEALQSCFSSVLPTDTEFVIVDNGSTDGTGEVVRQYFRDNSKYNYIYEYEEDNLGVGGGRSRAFDLANGKYLYFLDDDAVIAPDSYENFFFSAIKFLEKNQNVASITTRIEDTVVSWNRNDNISSTKIDGRPIAFYYLGGSHFLRKSAFDSPLYFPIKYGSEEYAPSITVQDRGMFHVYFDDISIIHKPKVNKWINGTVAMKDILCRSLAIVYATKVLLYPVVFKPILKMGYRKRCNLYLKQYEGAIKEADTIAKTVIKDNSPGKIKVSTVLRMFNNFGMKVF